jgi:hypothetical protein
MPIGVAIGIDGCVAAMQDTVRHPDSFVRELDGVAAAQRCS